jgi:hypothetical protein
MHLLPGSPIHLHLPTAAMPTVLAGGRAGSLAAAGVALLGDRLGRRWLHDYYLGWGRRLMAATASADLVLATPTLVAGGAAGTASPAAGAPQDRLNRRAVQVLRTVAGTLAACGPVRVTGLVAGRPAAAGGRAADARRRHAAQLQAFARAGADQATAVVTLGDCGEAIGIVQAAGDAGLPVALVLRRGAGPVPPSRNGLVESMARIDAATDRAVLHYLMPQCLADLDGPGWSEPARTAPPRLLRLRLGAGAAQATSPRCSVDVVPASGPRAVPVAGGSATGSAIPA